MESREGLLARWRLDGDCRDCSGNGNRGSPHSWDGGPFDGRSSYIEVDDDPTLHLGCGDFSIAAWVHTEEPLDDCLGDIVAKYDPETRTGFNLSINNFYGVTSSQPDYRNLFFGLDSRSSPGWMDCGRPGEAVMVWALCVYSGDLYAGTFEIGEGQSGHIYRYTGGNGWIDCGSPHSSNAITSLAVHGGKLYAAASHYRSSGSSLAESGNTAPGGKVFRYRGGTDWEDCGKVGQSESIGGLATFSGCLYASSMYDPPGLYRYDGGRSWTDCGNPGGRVESLGVFHGNLYGSGWDAERGGVYRYDGNSSWSDCGIPPGNTQTYSFAAYRGLLHVGTWPSGRVFKMVPRGWKDCGRLGEEKEVMGIAVYNGKLYAGTLPSARVYRYDGDGWNLVGQLDSTPGVKYRRAWSMAVYGGRLYCGTLPSGRVWSMGTGGCVSLDRELGPGWSHVAAVRESGRINLLVNGIVAGTIDPGREFNISNSRTLTIGFGEHDYFRGQIRDLRLYSRALTGSEVISIWDGGHNGAR